MTKSSTLPDEYVPFDILHFCGNAFVNGKIPIKMGGEIPLLIGKGETLQVWLYVPVTADGKNWEYVVEKSRVRSPKVVVEPASENSVLVKVVDRVVVSIRKISDTEAVVDYVDLRPVGLNIHGNESCLWVGNAKLSHNRFENVNTMINIGS